MIETFNALLDVPALLLVILMIRGVIGIGVEKVFSAQQRGQKRAYWQRRNARKPLWGKPASGKAEPQLLDFAADQLKLVMKADFRRRPLLNNAEGNVFRILDKNRDRPQSGMASYGPSLSR